MSKVYKVVNSKSISIRSISLPVGMVIITTTEENPSTYTVGTWEQFASGRTLVGVDASQTEFNTVLKTGGEATHTLTASEMPRHQHNIGNANAGGTTVDWTKYFPEQSGVVKGWWTNIYTNFQGGNGSHNNLQPYVTVYFWKRIA